MREQYCIDITAITLGYCRFFCHWFLGRLHNGFGCLHNSGVLYCALFLVDRFASGDINPSDERFVVSIFPL